MNEVDLLKQAIRTAFPDMGKLTFRRQGEKQYLTVESDILDPDKAFKDFKIVLGQEADKHGWSVGMTSTNVFSGKRTATFRINYTKNF